MLFIVLGRLFMVLLVVVVVKALFLSGHQETVAGTQTLAIVMVTRTAYLHYLYLVPLRGVINHGILKNVLRH